MARRRCSWVLLAAVALVGSGCEDEPPPPAPPRPVYTPPPVDRLAPGELAEGVVVFGVTLPRGMKVKNNGHEWVMAVGNLKFEQVASYMRDHLEAERVETGPAKTLFTGVTTTDNGKARKLRVEVADTGSGLRTRIDLYDETPVEVPDDYKELSVPDRWKRVGLTPDGKPIDPEKFE